MSTIRKKLVPDVQANTVTYGKGNAKKYIVVHETDNARSGADADAHSRLQYTVIAVQLPGIILWTTKKLCNLLNMLGDVGLQEVQQVIIRGYK